MPVTAGKVPSLPQNGYAPAPTHFLTDTQARSTFEQLVIAIEIGCVPLFKAQRYNWIELGRSVCRVETRENADAPRETAS